MASSGGGRDRAETSSGDSGIRVRSRSCKADDEESQLRTVAGRSE